MLIGGEWWMLVLVIRIFVTQHLKFPTFNVNKNSKTLLPAITLGLWVQQFSGSFRGKTILILLQERHEISTCEQENTEIFFEKKPDYVFLAAAK
jgi:hypothetical protein